MNSLSHGFFFLVGLSWLLCEVCVGAGAGYWTPVWIFLAGFCVMFAIMGCLPLSDKTINTAGPVFTLLIGAGIVFYGIEAALSSSILGAVLRFIGGVPLVVLGLFGLLQREKSHAH